MPVPVQRAVQWWWQQKCSAGLVVVGVVCEEEEEEEEEEEAIDSIHAQSGLETPSGLVSTVPSEFGAAENIGGEFDVRKHHRGTETEEYTQPKAAYRVIPEQASRVQGFFGGDRVYDLKAPEASIPVLGSEESHRKRKKPEDVEVSMDPDMLQSSDGISKEHLKGLYDAEKKQEFSQWNFQEDLSDMIASEHKRIRKEEERRAKR